jgi:hypothetical protein
MKSRHGPQKLATYRLSKKKWTAEATKTAAQKPDRRWEGDLENAFEQIAIDEAHLIKKPDTAAHTTVAWLNASFHILVTASVLPNGVDDWLGFQKFIDINRNLWDPANLARLGVTTAVNPYEQLEGHPARVLGMTTEAAERYIIGPNADGTKQGYYLSQIWKECLIRQT